LDYMIPACVARALHSTVRADGTHMPYARSFITCDNTHFRTIFFSPGDRSLMGWGKAGVIYGMDSLLHASSAPLLSLHLHPNTPPDFRL
jgi:hypothetical protein